MLTNGQLALLLDRAANREDGHRRRALERAARAAMFWPLDAGALLDAGRELTELRSVGPWVAGCVRALLEDPPEVPDPDPLREDFLTVADARRILAERPGWTDGIRADLQIHTTDSDGSLALPDMAEAVASMGYEYAAITDHSKSLTIAHGMDEARLARQGDEIEALNAAYERDGRLFRLLRSIEMDVFMDGSIDMDGRAVDELDLVLGAFHTNLRSVEDQTDRYLAALASPHVHLLAHPRARKFGRRFGLRAHWPAVFEEAARLDKALEIDASPDRQDLNVQLLRLARDAGVRLSIGTDAHHPVELGFIDLGLAAAALAEVPRERILNFLPVDEVLAWSSSLRGSPRRRR